MSKPASITCHTETSTMSTFRHQSHDSRHRQHKARGKWTNCKQLTIVCEATDIFIRSSIVHSSIELKHVLTVTLAMYKAILWIFVASFVKKMKGNSNIWFLLVLLIDLFYMLHRLVNCHIIIFKYPGNKGPEG